MTNNLKIDDLKSKFNMALAARDKSRCAELVLDAVEGNEIKIPELYEEVLSKSLGSIANNEKEQKIDIWEEHIRSGIVRSMIEMCYPYIRREKSSKKDMNISAVIFCIEEEYHELGARMITDLLTLMGFETYFIGANTPLEEVCKAIAAIKPRLVGISVTNYYDLIKIQDIIDEIRDFMKKSGIGQSKILLGGYAVKHTPGVRSKIHPDYFADSYEDLKKIGEDVL